MTRQTILGVVAAVISALSVSGCNGGGRDPGPTTIPTLTPTTDVSTSSTTTSTTSTKTSTTSTTSSSTTTTSLSAVEQDEANATETLLAYEQALGAASRGEAEIESLYPWAIDTAREQWVTQLMNDRALGWIVTGETSLEVVEIEVEDDQAMIVACVDVSAVEVVDENGESVITEDRLPQTLNDYVLERSETGDFGWLVIEDVNRSEPCNG